MNWAYFLILLNLSASAGVEQVPNSSQTSPHADRKGKKGMILPFQPLTMTFHNVNYFVDTPKVSFKFKFVCLCPSNNSNPSLVEDRWEQVRNMSPVV